MLVLLIKSISVIFAILFAATVSIINLSALDSSKFTSNFKFQVAPVMLTLFNSPILLFFISNVEPFVISSVDVSKLFSFSNLRDLFPSIFTALLVILFPLATVTSPCIFTFEFSNDVPDTL